MKKSKKHVPKKAGKVVKKAAKKIVSKKAAPANYRLRRSPANGGDKSGVTPLGDRVLISPTVPESVTSFGLIIPETVDKEKPETGVVVAVGPGRVGDDNMLIPVGVSVGDHVMFDKYNNEKIKINGTEYYILTEQYILAILK